jgi:hypothetical protein
MRTFALLEQKFESTHAQLTQGTDAAFVRLVQDIDKLRDDTKWDRAAMDLGMTVKLGPIVVTCFGLTIAAMRLWM